MEISNHQLLILQLMYEGKIAPDIEEFEGNQTDGDYDRFTINREQYDKYLSKTFGIEKDSSYLNEILEELCKLKLIKGFEFDDFLVITQQGRAYFDSKISAKKKEKWNVVVHIITFIIAIAGLIIALIK